MLGQLCAIYSTFLVPY